MSINFVNLAEAEAKVLSELLAAAIDSFVLGAETDLVLFSMVVVTIRRMGKSSPKTHSQRI